MSLRQAGAGTGQVLCLPAAGPVLGTLPPAFRCNTVSAFFTARALACEPVPASETPLEMSAGGLLGAVLPN
jgi:hypothetical protein